MEWLLLLCDLDEHKSHSLAIPPTEGRLLLSGSDLKYQVGHKDLHHKNGQAPGFFAIVTGSEGDSCMSVQVQTISCATLTASNKACLRRCNRKK